MKGPLRLIEGDSSSFAGPLKPSAVEIEPN